MKLRKNKISAAEKECLNNFSTFFSVAERDAMQQMTEASKLLAKVETLFGGKVRIVIK